MLNIVLYEPKIPANTGNIIRLCANIGAKLHLIKPYGFEMDDKRLRRAGLDYRELACVTEYSNFEEFLANYLPANPKAKIYCLTTKGTKYYTNIKYHKTDVLVFGSETNGLPDNIREGFNKITIPMQAKSRSINLSNSVAIASYEFLRQLNFSGLE